MDRSLLIRPLSGALCFSWFVTRFGNTIRFSRSGRLWFFLQYMSVRDLSVAPVTHRHPQAASGRIYPLCYRFTVSLLLSCLYLTTVSRGMFQGYGQVAACGCDLRRGRTRKHCPPQAGTDGNGTSRRTSCPTRYFLFQPSACGAICGNITQSHTERNNVRINALSWQPNANYTAHENTILTAPGHRIPLPLNCNPAVSQPSAPYRLGRFCPARKGDRYRYPVMQPERPRLSNPYRLLNITVHPPAP